MTDPARPSPAKRPPSGLLRDRRGATIIEFAFVSLPFFALLIAILQTSLVFFAQQALDTAAEKAVRPLLTGSVQSTGMTAAQYKTLACTKLPAFLKCGNLMVDVSSATNFSSASTAAPTITFDSNGNVTNSWSYDPGDSSKITTVRLMYIWTVSPGPLNFNLATLSNGRRLLVSTSVFKAENY